MSNPFFSVVVPAYNPGRFLLAALQSVVEQTFTDWELLVIDDGSRPDEATVIEDAVRQARELLGANRVLDANGEERIRFYQQENQGVSVTRNFSIGETRAPWLAFLDNDDLWKPTMLEQWHRLLTEKPETALCHTNFDLIDENGAITGAGYGVKISYLRFLEGHFSVLPCCSVVSREVVTRLGGFDPIYPLSQDLDLYLKIYNRHEARVEFLPEVLASYRIHGANASKSYRSAHREITHVLQKHLLLGEHLKKTNVVRAARTGIEAIKKTYSAQAFDCARGDLKHRRQRDFLSNLTYAFRLHPAFVLRQFTSRLKRK